MPPRLVAVMVSVWVPMDRLLVVQGLLHGVAVPPSRLQTTAAVGSLTVKVMVASVDVVDGTGPLMVVTAGAPMGGGGGDVTVQL